jgi:hypothetical protein
MKVKGTFLITEAGNSRSSLIHVFSDPLKNIYVFLRVACMLARLNSPFAAGLIDGQKYFG